MGTSDEVNITWTWILQPRHSRHRTTHGSLIGAGFGRQRSLKVFPALAPAAPQAPGLLFCAERKEKPWLACRLIHLRLNHGLGHALRRRSFECLQPMARKLRTYFANLSGVSWGLQCDAFSTRTRRALGISLASLSPSLIVCQGSCPPQKHKVGAVITAPARMSPRSSQR